MYRVVQDLLEDVGPSENRGRRELMDSLDLLDQQVNPVKGVRLDQEDSMDKR